jgi:hypothetical protein
MESPLKLRYALDTRRLSTWFHLRGYLFLATNETVIAVRSIKAYARHPFTPHHAGA